MNNVFEFEGRSSKVAIPFLVIGIILFVLAVAQFFLWAFAAAIPIALFLILMSNNIKRREIEISEYGLTDKDSHLTIGWNDIRGVWCKNLNLMAHRNHQLDSKKIVIEHGAGYIMLYDNDVAKMASFVSFIMSNVKAQQPNLAKPVINSYLHQEQETFGDNLITVCRQAPKQATSWSTSYRFSGTLTLVLFITTIVLWIAFAVISDNQRGNRLSPAAGLLLVFGITASVMTIVCFFAYVGTMATTNRSYSMNAAIVISPRGFAMSQKDLDGSITWSEIKSLNKNRQGIILKVAGAQIIIMDIYDLPLNDIYALMKSNL